MSRHDSDFASAGRNDSRAIRADQTRLLVFRNAQARIMSNVGMPSVMQTTSSIPASVASMIASAAKGGGTKMTEALAPVFARFSTVLNTAMPSCFVPPFAGRHSADNLRSVFHRLKRVERAFAAGKSLNDRLACFYLPVRSSVLSRRRHDFFSRVLHSVGDNKIQTRSCEDFLSLLDVGAFQPHDDRHFHARSPWRPRHNARSQRRRTA